MTTAYPFPAVFACGRGVAVRTYAKASELLGAAELPDRGCLVVEYNLPDMTGLDLVAQLRNRQVALPAILITTNPSGIVRRRAEEAGVPMIEKPLLDDSLINGILAVLTRLPITLRPEGRFPSARAQSRMSRRP